MTRKLADALQTAETAAGKDTNPDFTVTTLKVGTSTQNGEVELTVVQNSDNKSYTASLPAGFYLFLDVTENGGHIANGTVDDQNTANDSQQQGEVVVNSAPIILSSGELGTKDAGTEGVIVNPVASSTVNFKNHVTPVTKSHDDKDNTVSTGQALNYTLQSTIPAFITGYDKTTYTFQLTDTPGVGQDVNLSGLKVTVNGTEVKANATDNPTGYELKYSTDVTNDEQSAKKFSANGTKTFTIDLSKYVQAQTYDATKDNKVVVTYKATITATATSSATTGVVNKVEVNDNNNKATDQTKVTLGKFSFTKVDAQGNPVATEDAEFTIAAKTNDANAVTPTTAEATSNDKGVVTFDGLADGTYTVEETGVPAGYFETAKAKFEVTIKGGKAVYFNGIDAWGLAPDSADNTQSDTEITDYKVKNVKNITELPKTGAAGIAMFGVIAALLAGAAVTVYAKSRATKRALRA